MHILWPIPSLYMYVSNPNVHQHYHKTQSNHKTHQSPSLQVDTKFSIISAFVDRCDENNFIIFCFSSLLWLWMICYSHVHYLSQPWSTGSCACWSTGIEHMQICNSSGLAVRIFDFWWICIMFRSSTVRFIVCLNSLALKGSVEDADESNEGDEKEPPPKNQENLG